LVRAKSSYCPGPTVHLVQPRANRDADYQDRTVASPPAQYGMVGRSDRRRLIPGRLPPITSTSNLPARIILPRDAMTQASPAGPHKTEGHVQRSSGRTLVRAMFEGSPGWQGYRDAGGVACELQQIEDSVWANKIERTGAEEPLFFYLAGDSSISTLNGSICRAFKFHGTTNWRINARARHPILSPMYRGSNGCLRCALSCTRPRRARPALCSPV